jgi:hypothetical protein
LPGLSRSLGLSGTCNKKASGATPLAGMAA